MQKKKKMRPPPNTGETGAPKIKEFNITRLDNGVRIITERVPYVESFAMGISVRAGSRDEAYELPGVAHFLEHAAFRRTKTRTSRQIAAQFESLGAYSNAFTTQELTCFFVRGLKRSYKKCAELLSDVVLNPKFHPGEFEKEKNVILEEVKYYEDDPEESIFDFGDAALFGEHPLGNPIVGSKASLEKIQIKDLEEFHSNYYIPENIVITAAGNVDHDDIADVFSKYFSDLKSAAAVSHRSLPNRPNPSYLEKNMPFQQAHILFGRRVPGIDSADRFTLSILNIIIGDGMSSRLNFAIREKAGAAYTVYSNLALYDDCGALYLYAGADEAQSRRTIEMTNDELIKLKSKPIRKAEFERGREQLTSGLIMDMESMSSRMQSLGKFAFIENGLENARETINKINSVTIDDVNRIACEISDPESWSKIIFLPEEETEIEN